VPNYSPHSLVTFGGVLNLNATETEIWQCGVRVRAVGTGGPLADHDAYLASASTALSAWFSDASTAAKFPASATLNWMKANPIQQDGKYSDPNTHLHDFTTPVPGASTSTTVPDILCICLSWQTGKAIRKGSYATHGRIYPPNYLAAAASGDMRLSAGVAGFWAARGHALLAALNGTGHPCVPIIASPHSHEQEPITGCRVGDVYDSQRRRKSALKEVYTAVAYASG